MWRYFYINILLGANFIFLKISWIRILEFPFIFLSPRIFPRRFSMYVFYMKMLVRYWFLCIHEDSEIQSCLCFLFKQWWIWNTCHNREMILRGKLWANGEEFRKMGTWVLCVMSPFNFHANHFLKNGNMWEICSIFKKGFSQKSYSNHVLNVSSICMVFLSTDKIGYMVLK